MSPPNSREKGFIQYLERFAVPDNPDRAALASLKRGLRSVPGTMAETYKYVVPFLQTGLKRWEEDNYYITASLFAWHHEPYWQAEKSDGKKNLGYSMKLLQREMGTENQSTERRFSVLLNSHADDLPRYLRQIIGLLKSKNIPVDYAQLLHDLHGWNSESRYIQRAWAKSFWGYSAEEKSVEETKSEEITENQNEKE